MKLDKKKIIIISVLAVIVVALIAFFVCRTVANKNNTTPTVSAYDSDRAEVLQENLDNQGEDKSEESEVDKYKDKIAPIISLKGNSEVSVLVGDVYEDEGCTVQDNLEGDITDKVVVTGKVDTQKEGTYIVNYLVEDSAGNKTEANRKVTVKKKEMSDNNEGESKTVATSASSANSTSKNNASAKANTNDNAKNNTTSNTKTSSANTTKTTTSSGKGRGLPVLMYHFFYDKKAGEKGPDNNWMEISDFEAQMKYLSDNNFYFPSWTEVENYIDGKTTLPEKSVVITIDDGDETFIRLAIPIIEKYKVKATSFVVTSWNGDWLPKQYRSAKLDFQSHSHDMHRAGANGKGRFVNLSYNEALKDVTTSKNIIGNCTVFCYPFGHYNDNAKKVLKDAGYKLAFTTEGGRVYKGANKFQLPRVRMSKGISLNSFKEKVK